MLVANPAVVVATSAFPSRDFSLSIDDHPRLESDLTGPGYELDSKVPIQLESKDEMKKRGVDSPDDADALALTFARRVAAPRPEPKRVIGEYRHREDHLQWMN